MATRVSISSNVGRKFLVFLIAISWCITVEMFGQTESATAPLTVETNLPDLQTNVLLNDKSNEHRLTVIANPEDSTNIIAASHDSSGSAIRFFRGVKSFFGIDNVIHLFNGNDLENFYPWLADTGTYLDPDRVFSVENGMIRISGQHQGFLATKAQFGDYKLVAEFKWGDATWYKHKETPRNSGVFVNAFGVDSIDMKSIELQIVEPNARRKEGTGDIVLHGKAKIVVGNEMKARPWDTFYRESKKPLDASTGQWNKMEVVVEGDQVRITVNGKAALAGRRASPSSGKILLQSNGAEIFFRRVDIYPLETNNVSNLKGQGKGP